MEKKNQLTVKKINIPKMLDTVNGKIKSIENNMPEPTITEGHVLQMAVNYDSIKTLDNEVALIRCYASVMQDEKTYKAAFKEMGIKGKIPEIVLCGHSIKDWKKDIMDRYEQFALEKQLIKLYKAKIELEKNLSEKDRLKNSMIKIQDILAEK